MPLQQIHAAGSAWPLRWKMACQLLAALLVLQSLLLVPMALMIMGIFSSTWMLNITMSPAANWVATAVSIWMPVLVVWWVTEPSQSPGVGASGRWARAARWSLIGFAVLDGSIPPLLLLVDPSPILLSNGGYSFFAVLLALLSTALLLAGIVSLIRWRASLAQLGQHRSGWALDGSIIACWSLALLFQAQGPVVNSLQLNVGETWASVVSRLIYLFPFVIGFGMLLGAWRAWSSREMFTEVKARGSGTSRSVTEFRATSWSTILQATAVWFLLVFLWNSWGGLLQIALLGSEGDALQPGALILLGTVGVPVALLLPVLLITEPARRRKWVTLGWWILPLLLAALLGTWSRSGEDDVLPMATCAAGLMVTFGAIWLRNTHTRTCEAAAEDN